MDTASTPNWSPDGRSLLFGSARTIWLMAADGSRQRKLTHGTAPAFAPDGRHYVYTQRSPGTRRYDVRRAAIDGSEDRRLGTGRFPQWSPDGRTIAYYRSGIWIMNARTGKDLRRVAPADFVPRDWSPNGRRLLCMRLPPPATLGTDMFVVRADGTGAPRQVTRTADQYEGRAAWSPDGRSIVLGRDDASARPYIRYSVVTQRLRGGPENMVWTTPLLDPEDENLVGWPPSVSWQSRPD